MPAGWDPLLGKAAPTIPPGLAEGRRVGLGRFTLIRELGRGGMGVVWLARDDRLKQEVALKLLPPEVAADELALEALRQETLKSQRLAHPYIVAIRDLHEAPGEPPFILMEYVAGDNLRRLLSQQPQRRFTWEYLRPLVGQLCEALNYAHGENIIHRDLKPANLMLDAKGRLKLADFGIAATLSDSMSRVSRGSYNVSGTLVYMSPQQMNGRQPRPTDDIYSLGATLYELLTGHPPFYTGGQAAIIHQVHNVPPVPMGESLLERGLENNLPPEVGRAVLDCLAKERDNRPQSAAEVWARLTAPAPANPAAGIFPPTSDDQKLKSEIRNLESAETFLPTPVKPRRWKVPAMVAAVLAVIGLACVVLKWHPTSHSLGAASVTHNYPQADQRCTNSLGQVFAPVPGTGVLFCIWDTRVQDFTSFVNDTGYDATQGMYSLRSDGWKQRGDTWKGPGFAQGPTYPVVGVSWEDASNFCRWLTEKERKAGLLGENQSYRLPTDAEWSMAVGDDKYPWGDQWPPPAGAGNYAGSEAADGNWPGNLGTIAGYQDGYARTSPVGSFVANRLGLYDMGGNVWQWCEDWYRKELNSAEIRQKLPLLDDDGGGQQSRVLRGASWYVNVASSALSAFRSRVIPGNRSDDGGFRCVMVAGGVVR